MVSLVSCRNSSGFTHATTSNKAAISAASRPQLVIAAKPPLRVAPTAPSPSPTEEPYEPYVDGDVLPPRIIHRIQPHLSGLHAHHRRSMGIYEATITKSGQVATIRIIHSIDHQADQAITAALSRWEFKPATRNGVPVAARLNLTVHLDPL